VNMDSFEPALLRFYALMKSKRISPLMLAGLTPLALLTIFSAGFAVSALIMSFEPASLAKSEWRPPTLSALAPPPSTPAGLDEQTLTRPIFTKSRRPSSSARQASMESTAHTESAPPGFALGAIIGFGPSKRAYLLGHGATAGEWLSVGEMFEGWTIAEIGELNLTLKSGARIAILKLYPDPP
jgi:hypothetical protein